ncbi:MAG: phosphoribosyl 1,2-cyclic phosphate phosphodiesterase [Cellvibrionaceae bacterium]|jgi:phosphoribosyl 1,2-cyclic phosphate phosphodiesterase
MIIEFLGTGGATTTPRPGSKTESSLLARKHKTPPWTRSGPGLFLHGPDILIDTSEDIWHQLVASDIDYINVCFYSHWHPDHTAGKRVFESNIRDYSTVPFTMAPPTDVYLPQQVAVDARQWLAIWDSLMYHQNVLKVVKVHVLQDGEQPVFKDANNNDVAITPFRLHEDYVYGFQIETGDKRVVHVADEMYNWEPAAELKNPDLAILPAGLFEFHPLTGDRIMQANHPLLTNEATFRQTLAIAENLGAAETIITHLEEAFDMTPETLAQVEAKLKAEGKNIRFAFDQLKVEI